MVKLEQAWDTEFGFPSTHVGAAALPLHCLVEQARLGVTVAPGAWGAALCWTALVAVSRIYVGAHFLQDIVAGAVYTALLIALQVVGGNAADTLFIHR